jgi:hypothetical protein
MKTYNFKKGKVGEEIAINFLQNKGFKILIFTKKIFCAKVQYHIVSKHIEKLVKEGYFYARRFNT